jgi:hypothetical protein
MFEIRLLIFFYRHQDQFLWCLCDIWPEPSRPEINQENGKHFCSLYYNGNASGTIPVFYGILPFVALVTK